MTCSDCLIAASHSSALAHGNKSWVVVSWSLKKRLLLRDINTIAFCQSSSHVLNQPITECRKVMLYPSTYLSLTTGRPSVAPQKVFVLTFSLH